ncbi:peptidylprolyl isomerase [Chitinimonas lacunae]|uniref:peptidylprolyl isomerase n=1 Tax=Chitinimonas lacunae TaxID=1963018 RepID=A0ABV8MLM4_9NEIS
MAILINDHEITDAEIAAELPHHQDCPNPLQRATTAVALRHILLDEAARLGLPIDSEEAAIEALLQSQIKLPQADEASCRRHYELHPQRFTVGELVLVDHILFQVTPNVPLGPLRELAEQTLQEILQDPALFATRARELSNCPSGQVGGSLGQISRGETVPEFERVVFAMASGEILPRLLETRFGLHIIRVVRRIDGHLLPYEQVADPIANALHASSIDAAWRQYTQLLVGRARVQGIELAGASSPLVQ